MKEESTYENMQEVKEKKVDIQEIFFKYPKIRKQSQWQSQLQ